MRSKGPQILTITGAIGAGAFALAWRAYRKEIKAARERIETGRKSIDSKHGPIEFAESGEGPAVLLIHGAGGGFDQGLDLGRFFLGDKYRIIAPSRFGYLGTPLPANASPEAQADAHAELLDALHVDRVPVVGVSAGAPSAMQFCLNYPERCEALVLVVPLAYTPEQPANTTPSSVRTALLNGIAGSDFLFWAAMKLAHSTLVKTILGTPIEDYRRATAEERRGVDLMLQLVLPVSRRVAGIWNDAATASTLTRYPLENIHVPTLVITAVNCLYGTYERGLYTAAHIDGAKFVPFQTGGHLLVGHDIEARAQITTFLNECLEAKKTPALAG